MLLRYFGLIEEPFGVTPDPRCLFESPTHREALASLTYACRSNRGFTALIAPPGMGKTTLLFRFLDDIRKSARTVFLFDTQCEPLELLRSLLRDLGITPSENGVEMREQLKGVLVTEARAGRKLVVVIDEAQNLPDDSLEMIRLLTNFETRQAKLMQIVLAGQPKLSEKLMNPALEQLQQRISTYCRLEPFSLEETVAYIAHRLKRSGYEGPPLFTEGALTMIQEASRGIPRTINNLCFNALSLCCALKGNQVDESMAAEVIADLQLTPVPKQTNIVPREPAVEQHRNPDPEPESFSEPRPRKHGVGRVRIWASAAALLMIVSSLCAFALFKHLPSQAIVAAEAKPLSVKVQPAVQSPPFQITVRPNDRLKDLAVHYLGEFNQQRLNQIKALNPKLTDPDHIEVGQRLWLPGTSSIPRLVNASHEPSAVRLNELHSVPTDTSKWHAITDYSVAKQASFEVTVGPNQRLRDIAVQYLGGFDLQRLHQIQKLNPNLTNPDHILIGQKIRLPGNRPVAVANDMIANASEGKLP